MMNYSQNLNQWNHIGHNDYDTVHSHSLNDQDKNQLKYYKKNTKCETKSSSRTIVM